MSKSYEIIGDDVKVYIDGKFAYQRWASELEIEKQEQIELMKQSANRLIDSISDILDIEDWDKFEKLHKADLETLGVI